MFAARTDGPEAGFGEPQCNLRRLRSSARLTILALALTKPMLVSEETPTPPPRSLLNSVVSSQHHDREALRIGLKSRLPGVIPSVDRVELNCRSDQRKSRFRQGQ